MVDISPGSIGNLASFATYEAEMRHFLTFLKTSIDTGSAVNPVTGQPYEPQIVPLRDLRSTRQFSADGPESGASSWPLVHDSQLCFK